MMQLHRRLDRAEAATLTITEVMDRKGLQMSLVIVYVLAKLTCVKFFSHCICDRPP